MIDQQILDKLEFQKILQFAAKYSVTEKGKSKVAALRPLANTDLVKIEGDYVNQAKNILISQNSPPFDFIPDLDTELSQSRIEGAALDSKKILEILRLAVISRNIFQFLKNQSDAAPDLYKLSSSLFVDKVFEHHITKIVNENGEVKDNASPKLAEIKKDIYSKRDELIKSVNRLIKTLSENDIVREDYLTLRDGRIVIPVKVEHKRHIKGFIHSESSTGQTVYIEPEETLDLNNDIISLTFAEKREIERLLRELTKLIGMESDKLKIALDTIAELDSVFARAKYSIEVIGSFPRIENDKPFNIMQGKHPILFKKLGREGTIPLNVLISDNKIVIITGPNAGGKTVVLKTIGILSLMVLSGMHIPADPDSNFHSFDNILVDIGDEQSLEDDLSTFSSHLSNIKEILGKATRNSLVLLDEIGTGTDPSEGSALASAMLLKLMEKGSIVLASTHHGSLKLFANDITGFQNAAMEFDTRNLRPTYIFKQGIPGSSYAFEIAKRIGFEDDFLNIAREHLDAGKHNVEKFLVDIESKSRELEEKLKTYEIENARLNGLSDLYKKNIEQLNSEKKEILKKTKVEAENYLKGINKKIEEVIKSLKESNADKNIIKTSQKIVRELKEGNKELFSESIEIQGEKFNFVAGDFVAVRNTNTSGKILQLSPDKKKATILSGNLKMKIDVNELVPVKKEEKVETTYSSYSDDSAGQKVRIDIRGERADQAEFEVLKFLDGAYSAGLNRVEILHGKGTGALKEMVQRILKDYDKVNSFHFAPIESGGDGITIAEFK
jgi:DNA mismatch repair protein MutS2